MKGRTRVREWLAQRVVSFFQATCELKEELTLIQLDNRSIPYYLHTVKALVDKIAIVDHSIFDDDLTLYVLNGLSPDFCEIVAPIQAQEKPLTFEELHDLLIGHENYLC